MLYVRLNIGTLVSKIHKCQHFGTISEKKMAFENISKFHTFNSFYHSVIVICTTFGHKINALDACFWLKC